MYVKDVIEGHGIKIFIGTIKDVIEGHEIIKIGIFIGTIISVRLLFESISDK